MKTLVKFWYVGWQEIPGYTNLIVPIQGCKRNCYGCHSPEYADENIGVPLTSSLMDDYIEKYGGVVNSVVFFGGDQYQSELAHLIPLVRSKVVFSWYTGLDSWNCLDPNLIKKLKYIKIGRYIRRLGALDDPRTNQRLYEVDGWKDCTSEFFWS